MAGKWQADAVNGGGLLGHLVTEATANPRWLASRDRQVAVPAPDGYIPG